jgi:hypothetical protein
MMFLTLMGLAAAAGQPALSHLVQEGRLAEAQAMMERSHWTPPPAAPEHLAGCRMLLWSNRLAKASDCLATEEKRGNAGPEVRLLEGEAFSRQGKWREAAASYAAGSHTTLAERARAFAEQPPYQGLPARTVSIPFAAGDPLPVIPITLPDGREHYFIVDTGGWDLVLDPSLASTLNVRSFGDASGTFAGGRKATYRSGLLSSLTLAGTQIRNVPVILLPTSGFQAVGHGRAISGVVGYGLLREFQTTIDYPGARLVLRPRDAPRRRGVASIPLWQLGDHYVAIEGSLEGVAELTFIDTGMAGGGCTAPASSIAEAKIALSGSQAVGNGGGGPTSVRPFVARRLGLGPVVVPNVHCFAGLFPPSLEHAQGARIGLLASHQAVSGFAVTFDLTRMQLVLARR